MSHTTEVNDIVFSDIEALKAAVDELNTKHKVKCTLLKNAKPRAYSTNQQGMGPADYVLHLTDSPYDVGFYEDKKLGGLVARTDFYMNHVQRLLGVPAGKGVNNNRASMGKLYNTYAVHAATRKARQQGMLVRRVDNKDGSTRLVLTGIR